MGKKVKARKSGKSLIMTIPGDVCALFGITEGSELELEPFTQNSLMMKVLK